MTSWDARRIVADAVRTAAREKAARRPTGDPLLSYLDINAELITAEVVPALVAAGLLREDEQ